ncbi:MAG TPA: hypothetical protein VNA24_30455 [Hyalangium sp.]|nr:hypothetical protein [Hyalangium sp.]
MLGTVATIALVIIAVALLPKALKVAEPVIGLAGCLAVGLLALGCVASPVLALVVSPTITSTRWRTLVHGYGVFGSVLGAVIVCVALALHYGAPPPPVTNSRVDAEHSDATHDAAQGRNVATRGHIGEPLIFAGVVMLPVFALALLALALLALWEAANRG